jgi:glycosyltransferase involved in cell wall biosynthesis
MADAREALDLPRDGPIVVLVARLMSIKRPDRFVAIARKLEERHPDTTFVVCGEGDLLAETRSGAPRNMRFLGWRADVETVYAASDLTVLTSDNEGMPVSLIEAAMCGLPAVATRVGSVSEVVLDGATGLITSVDVDDLASSVSLLLNDAPLRAQLGRAAARHARGAFGRDRLVADTELLYQQIAEQERLFSREDRRYRRRRLHRGQSLPRARDPS